MKKNESKLEGSLVMEGRKVITFFKKSTLFVLEVKDKLSDSSFWEVSYYFAQLFQEFVAWLSF